jgi:hypothetical protein
LVLAGGCGGEAPAEEEREPTPSEQVRELVEPLGRLTSYEIEMTYGDATARSRVSGVQRLDDGRVVEAAFTVEEAGDRFEARLLDDTFYVGDGADDGWVSVSTDDPDIEELGLSPDDLDVASSLEALADGVVAVRERPGRIVVDGATTRIVDVDVDPAQVEDLRTALGALPTDVDQLTYQLLVDEEGLVRRFTVRVPVGSEAVEVQATVSEPGAEVDVEEPADHLPLTVAELMGDDAA